MLGAAKMWKCETSSRSNGYRRIYAGRRRVSRGLYQIIFDREVVKWH